LFFNPLDLLPGCGPLLIIQLPGRRAGQPSLAAVHNRGYHFQIADQFGSRPGRPFLLPLRFEKQPGIVQNALADGRRSPPPGGIQCASLARIAAMLGEDGGHALAILQALPRHRHQKLHRHLCPDLARAHLLLDGLRQKLHQRQPPRYPFHAAIEPPRQLLQAVAETLLQLGQQPTHLQRGLVFGKAQRTIQHYSGGFAHRPHHCFHRVPPQLFQRRDPFVAVDDHVAVRLAFSRHHHDGHLLPAVSQRGQQPALALPVAHSQVLPATLQLVKLQLHPVPSGIQYAGGGNWSFPTPAEVGWELRLDQADTAGTGLSRHAGLVPP
jgi:hypothetical protein